jgi:hypothetical protein
MAWFANIEQTAFSVWVREEPSLFGFPFILYLHTLGLAMLAGLNCGINLWLLGGRTIPQSVAMMGVYRVMWLGFGINAVSGFALLAAYPAKALTNWVFYTKLLLIALAMWVLEGIKREVVLSYANAGAGGVTARAKQLATLSLFLWAGTVFAGRLLAYTHSILMASDPF